MITIILLTILFVSELVFSIWNLKTKKEHLKEKMYFRIIFTLFLLLGLLTGILNDTSRYGMLLFLCTIQTAIAILKAYTKKEHPFKPLRQFLRPIGALLLWSMALLPAIIFPQYTEPKVTGTHSGAVTQYTWTGEDRSETYTDTGENRSVTVKFWYPEEEGNYPLVIFSHGAFGVIDSNYSTFVELASNGYVVASIGHPYHAMMVEDANGNTTYMDMDFFNDVMTVDGSDTPEYNKTIYEKTQEWLSIRTGDMNFVLDTILEKNKNGEAGPFSCVDPEKIGLFGHSLGGATAVAVGRQRTDIDAVIDLEGTMFGEYVGFENGLYLFNEEPYPIPLLDVNSTAVYELESNNNQEYINFYVGEHAQEFHSVIFHNVGHLNFTDLPLVSPAIAGMLGTGDADAKECIESLNEMVLNYFDYYLKDMVEWKVQEDY